MPWLIALSVFRLKFERRGRDIFVEPNRKTKKSRLGRHIPFALKMPLLTELKTNRKIFSTNMPRLRRYYARRNFSASRKSLGNGASKLISSSVRGWTNESSRACNNTRGAA